MDFFFFFLKDDSAGYGKEHKGKAMEMMKSLENKTHEEGLVDLYFHTEMKKEVWFKNRPPIQEGLHHLEDDKSKFLIFKNKAGGNDLDYRFVWNVNLLPIKIIKSLISPEFFFLTYHTTIFKSFLPNNFSHFVSQVTTLPPFLLI